MLTCMHLLVQLGRALLELLLARRLGQVVGLYDAGRGIVVLCRGLCAALCARVDVVVRVRRCGAVL